MSSDITKRKYALMNKCFVIGAEGCPNKPEVKPNKIFVAMPFKQESHYIDLFAIIKDTLAPLGYEVVNAGEELSNIAINCKVCELIQESQFLIGEITERNPNVFLEIGIAFGLGKTVILLISKERTYDIPSDLKGIEYMEYDKNKMYTEFPITLKEKIQFIKSKSFKYDLYYGKYIYRLINLALILSVDSNGNSKTLYSFSLQKISEEETTDEIFFKMPYHDTPNALTSLETFNLQAALKPDSSPLDIDWILRSNVWKRFRIKLPPLKYEETHKFSVSMFELKLFTKDEPSDFYDLIFYYPTEAATLKILMPKGWEVLNPRIVIGETGLPAKGIEEISLNEDRVIEIKFKKPEVGVTYLVIWDWKNAQQLVY